MAKAEKKTAKNAGVPDWLKAGLDYAEQWMEYQLELTELPGWTVAVVHEGKLVWSKGFGVANLLTGEAMTPEHRFRVASHSKTFAAVAVLQLVEKGKLRLDEPIKSYLPTLKGEVRDVTLGQLLSHSAGVLRDGDDPSFWHGFGVYPNGARVMKETGKGLVIPAEERMKYSNFGYALVGLVIEAVTGKPYGDWVTQHVLQPAGLRVTTPDWNRAAEAITAPLAEGYTAEKPFGQRLNVANRFETAAIAPAGGMVSTAVDLALFHSQLSLETETPWLGTAMKRLMVKKHWRVPDVGDEQYYGYGLQTGTTGSWTYVGHGGGCPGFVGRTKHFPEAKLTISVLVNAMDGPPLGLLNGLAVILQRFKQDGAGDKALGKWAGRWYELWGCFDLVPVGKKVLAVGPGSLNPFGDAEDFEAQADGTLKAVKVSGYGWYGERLSWGKGHDGDTSLLVGGHPYYPKARFIRLFQERLKQGLGAA